MMYFIQSKSRYFKFISLYSHKKNLITSWKRNEAMTQVLKEAKEIFLTSRTGDMKECCLVLSNLRPMIIYWAKNKIA